MSKRKQRRRSSRRDRNVPLIKLVDPIIQSVLFILFLYALDADFFVPYDTLFYSLISVQILSLVVNFFLRSPQLELIMNERIAYAVVILVYLSVYYYMRTRIDERFLQVTPGSQTNSMPVYEVILNAVGCLIAFWYFFICFREVRDILKSEGSDFE